MCDDQKRDEGPGDACTIVCPERDYAGVLATLRATTDLPVDVAGPEDAWTRLVVCGPSSTLTITSMFRRAVGDEFSKIHLGMFSFFDSIRARDADCKRKVVRRVVDAEMFIGVVGRPGFSEADGHFDCIFAVAEKLDAMIFNGEGMLDGEGNMLLHREGWPDS